MKQRQKHRKPGPKPQRGLRAFVRRHRFAIASAAVVACGVAGVVAAAKSLPVGAATAVGIAVGYVTVTAVGAIGAMSIREGQLKVALSAERVPASG